MMKLIKTRFGRLVAMPLIAVMVLLASAGISSVVQAGPAAATTGCVVANNGAPCEPGVSAAQYHSALYICTVAKMEFGEYQYKGDWPSLRTCMDFSLVYNSVNVIAVELYTTDLYIHYHNDLWVWNVYNNYYSFMYVVAQSYASLGHILYELFLPVVCTGVVVASPESIAGAAGLGCDEAFAVIALRHNWKA